MGTYDVNPLLDTLKEKDNEEREKHNIFICGPSYRESRLRVYAYGGVLCKLPAKAKTGKQSEIELLSSDYQKYFPENPSLFVSMQGLKDNEAKYAFLGKHLNDLLSSMENWSKSGTNEDKERSQQTTISRAHTDFDQHDGTVVCDFQFAVPREYGYEGKKLPIFDLVTFSMNQKTGGGVFTLVEYKCNAKACEGEEGESGLKDHAADMLNCMNKPAASDWCKRELLRRLGYMRDYGLLQHWPKELDLEHLSSRNIELQAGFLFTPGAGLKNCYDAAELCKKHIPKDIRDDSRFFYCFAGSPETVVLSDMKSWKEFRGD